MTPEQIIEFYGSESQAAAKLGMTRQIINYWKQNRCIPIKTQAWIQLLTKGKLRADQYISK